MSDHDVELLVAPALLAATTELRVWHTGLAGSPSLLHLAVVMEPLHGENAITATLTPESLRNLAVIVSAVDHGVEPVHLAFGTTGGSNPTVVTRTDTVALEPGEYALTIAFTHPAAGVEIDYAAEFAVVR